MELTIKLTYAEAGLLARMLARVKDKSEEDKAAQDRFENQVSEQAIKGLK